MKKKLIYSVIVILVFSIAVMYVSFLRGPTNPSCAFCDTDVLKCQQFYEDDLVLALYNHMPVFPGHCLIISKRHVERFEMLTEEEVYELGRLIKKVDQAAMQVFKTSSYLLLQKNGQEVGQSVPHVHFHYIPREIGDDSILKFLLNMCCTILKKPLPAANMQQVVQELKQAINLIDLVPY